MLTDNGAMRSSASMFLLAMPKDTAEARSSLVRIIDTACMRLMG